MILNRFYDNENHTDKVWYDSSMIYYSSMVEDANENKGSLFITFKNGTCYCYKDVRFEDYLVFLGGGTDASQGKALNKVIKGKYDYEKMENSNIASLEEERQTLITEELLRKNKKEHTYFISGHRDLTEAEFEHHYLSLIFYTLSHDEECEFVIGDYEGADIMAQNFLMDVLEIDPSRVRVYHMFDKPRNINPKITETVGGFNSDEERDSAMTKASVADIALVRDNTKISGTAQNILRRNMLKKCSTQPIKLWKP